MVSKVLHVASGDLWAGAEVQIWMLVRNLKRQGLDVRVLLLNEGELARRLREDGISVYFLSESSQGFLSLIFATRRLLRDFQPDIVHSHRLKEHLIAALSRQLFSGPRLFRTVHGSAEFTPSLRQRVLRWLDHWFAKRSWSHTIAVSEPMSVVLGHQLGESQVSLVENAIDLTALRASANARAPHFSPGVIHFGIVGRLEPVKRVDRFIQAAIALSTNGQAENWHFHIIGDGSLRTALERMVSDAGISHRITFHGHVNNSTPYLLQLQAVVMCSEHEGMPMVALETLALGKYLVCNGVGGLYSLKDFRGCLIYDQLDPNGLSSALAAIACADPVTDELFFARYSVELMSSKMSELYRLEQPLVAACH